MSYAEAGVDVDAGEQAVQRIRSLVESTSRPEVLGELGGFAGAFAFDQGRYRSPVLVSSTDGVGTKAHIAMLAGRYDTIGVDLVAMCVDDLVCLGAEPLFLLDYVVTGKLEPEKMEEIVSGVARACREVGCALVGGEMAEHPGTMQPGEIDLAGFVVGVVERSEMLGAHNVGAGDVLVGLASPGLRSNGYSLARKVLLEVAGRSLDAPSYEGSERSLVDELLLPSVIYAPAVLDAVRTGEMHAAAHITGGGIPNNVARVLPPNCDAVVSRDAISTPEIFLEIQRLGRIDDAEMERVFNLGIGMVLVADSSGAQAVVEAARSRGCDAAVVGEVVRGSGQVHIERGRATR